MQPYLLVSLENVTPQLRSLFDPAMPASLRCFAVLDGHAVGLMATDDPANPTWGVVQEAGSGTVYLGGSLDAPLLAHFIAELRQSGDAMIGLWPGDPGRALLPPQPMYDGFTLEFTDRDANNGRDHDLMRVPPGCDVRRMNRPLFERCADRDYYATIFGGAEQALTRGIGFCLLRGEEILSEAFAGPTGLGMIEISVTTHEPHRRQGYATCTCAHLIRACEERALQTYWNCAKQNLPSAALARKLGYRTEKEYNLLAWFQLRSD